MHKPCEVLNFAFMNVAAKAPTPWPPKPSRKLLTPCSRLVHLTAMRREGRLPGRRIRPSGDLQARYRLFCDIPSAW